MSLSIDDSVNIFHLGELYHHTEATTRALPPNDLEIYLRHSFLNSRIMGLVESYLPPLFSCYINQAEIRQYPAGFVLSDRYSLGCKIFHMTVGTVMAGVCETLYNTAFLLYLAAATLFFGIKSIYDPAQRRNFPSELSASYKSELCPAVSALIKGILQLIPGLGIFLPEIAQSAYDGLKSFITGEEVRA